MATEVKRAIRTAAAWTADQSAMEALYGVGNYYTLLSTWESTEQSARGNLVSRDEIATAECYDDWPTGLSDELDINGWTVDSTRYPRVTVASGHRHTGIPQTGFFMKKSSSSSAVLMLRHYSRIEWVDVENTSTSSSKYGIRNYTATGLLTNVISKTAGSNGSAFYHDASGSGYEARCCLAYGSYIGFATNSQNAGTAKNCVAAGCTTGFGGSGGTGVATNCVSYSNTTNWATGWGASDLGSHNATSTGSDDAPGGDSVFGIDSADFVDAAGNDFHLASGSALIDVGTNLYSDFTTDIDGDTWPSSGAWDIGFDYFVSGGSTYTLSAATYVPGSITASAVTPRVTVTVA